ncbi:hypothetical protein [Micromonospora sp. DT233]|uniref:hypothetical protein n=1 Tax=Micromonospora sp. DT233 TaxID=3393432 RepID=UPI003CFB5C71
MSRTREKLARSYRRLLLCYPRRYRRARGEEIVATFLDLAPPDRTRPTIREAVNLVRNGLRCRLGRPNSRTVVLWATLTTVVWGLFTGAFATRLAWETARPLPTQAEATELFSRVLGQDTTGQVSVDPALFVIYGEPLGPDNLHFLFSLDAGEYQQGLAMVDLKGPSDVSHQGLVDSTRAWLRADGWQVTDIITRNTVQCTTSCDESMLPRDALFAARRGDRVLRLEISLGSPRQQPPKPGTPDNDGTYAHVELSRATPPAVMPFGTAGVALGMVFGWLTFGWASRRAESHRRPLRVLTTVLFGFATFMWYTPLLLGGRYMVLHHLHESHLSWHPMWEWIGQPALATLFVIGTVAALLALAACALPSRNREPATDVRSTA